MHSIFLTRSSWLILSRVNLCDIVDAYKLFHVRIHNLYPKEKSMRKSVFLIAALCFLVFSTVTGQQAKEEEKPNPMANFSFVDEIQPVPDDVKVGFESITAKDAVTYLKFT